jgi:adenine-specific DNA-methyltransferase
MLRAVHNTAVEILPQREAGVIYTKPWMVELILDLAGYLSERPLFKLVALVPSAEDGAFLQRLVRRLVEFLPK